MDAIYNTYGEMHMITLMYAAITDNLNECENLFVVSSRRDGNMYRFDIKSRVDVNNIYQLVVNASVYRASDIAFFNSDVSCMLHSGCINDLPI